jgi:membrane protein DedA with SNARE-associated domain
MGDVDLGSTILHFVAHYGYFGIFFILMFGIIGIPIPDELLMAFVGFLVWKGELHYFTAVLVGSLGSFTGMTLSYFIGAKVGTPILEKYGPKVHITPERVEKVHRWFERFGKLTVTIGYFVPGFRHLTSFTAGIGHWEYGVFTLYALPGAFLWVFTFVTLGKFLGRHWRVFTESLHHYMLVTSLVVGAGILICIWVRKVLDKKRTNLD